jgi:polysaccharide biosynthesis transport protein
VLLGEITCEQAIRPSGIENLSLIPAGTAVPNPGELLSLHRFDQFIALIRDEYDFVLLDSPPLLPVSDPMAIAARSDAVILQVRIRRNGRPAAIKAREMLDEIGAEVLGVVVSGADETQSYSYDYYGYRAYGYRSRGGGDRTYYDRYYNDDTAHGTKAR